MSTWLLNRVLVAGVSMFIIIGCTNVKLCKLINPSNGVAKNILQFKTGEEMHMVLNLQHLHQK